MYNPNQSNVKIVDDGSTSGRRFFIAPIINEPNEILSKFKRQTNLSIIATLEIENKSIKQSKNESLFCSFPLINGSKIELPITINCQSFETNTERNMIFLNKSQNDDVTESSVNKEILEQSIRLFRIIIDLCIEKN